MTNKIIGIIAGEPNSTASEIIFKAWKKRKKYKHFPFFIIGSFSILEKQKNTLGFKNLKLKKIRENFKKKDLMGSKLAVLNVNFQQSSSFAKISKKSKPYIFKCFDLCAKLIKSKKIMGLINCPVSKEHLFDKNSKGVTEYLSKKYSKLGKEVMLIYNKNLAVSPITTHIRLADVVRSLNKKIIIKKIETINQFYKKVLKKTPKIAVLGINPHNYSGYKKKSDEKNLVLPAIKFLKKKKINVLGPVSPDTSFMIYKKYKIDTIVGMYHDQVLTPFKSIFKFDAINITLGLPFIRISPDHGVGSNIVGKKIANPNSLIESIKFFNNLK